MAKNTLPTPEELRKLLEYDPATGALKWKARSENWFGPDRAAYRCRCWNTRYAGKLAFTAVSGGYAQGRVNGRLFLAHRVVWAIATGSWPQGQIDHINGDKLDNTLSNLRAVSQADNLRNAKMSCRNTSGHTGIYKTKTNKWSAQINVGHKSIALGTFDVFEDAVAARLRAERDAGFHPNHGKR